MFLEAPPSPIPATLDTLKAVAGGQLPPPNIHQQVKLVILVPLTATIILCNLMVVIFLIGHRKLHRPTYFFVGSLSVADFCVGWVSIWNIERANDSHFTLCLIRMGVLTSAIVSSLCFMVCIALDRYLAITAPLTYEQNMTKCRALLAIMLSCMLALSIGFAPLMGWDLNKSTSYCSFSYVDSPSYQIFLFVVGFGIPMALTITIYIVLYRNARVHIKRIELTKQVTSSATRRVNRRGLRDRWNSRTWKSIKTLLLMISCFLVTWSPFVMTSIIHMICGNACKLKDIISTYLLLLGFCNSFINPIIYAASNREFKAALSTSWTLCRRRFVFQ